MSSFINLWVLRVCESVLLFEESECQKLHEYLYYFVSVLSLWVCAPLWGEWVSEAAWVPLLLCEWCESVSLCSSVRRMSVRSFMSAFITLWVLWVCESVLLWEESECQKLHECLYYFVSVVSLWVCAPLWGEWVSEAAWVPLLLYECCESVSLCSSERRVSVRSCMSTRVLYYFVCVVSPWVFDPLWGEWVSVRSSISDFSTLWALLVWSSVRNVSVRSSMSVFISLCML